MTVELIGLPAAGKSTVAAELVEELVGQGRRPVTFPADARELAGRSATGRVLTALTFGMRRESIRWLSYRLVSGMGTIRFVLAHSALVGRLVVRGRLRHEGAAVGERRPLYWLLRHAGDRAMFRRLGRPDEVLIADEGFAHRVVQLFAGPSESPDPTAVAGYLNEVDRADLYVRLRVDRETAEARLRTRGTWAWLKSDEVPAFLVSALTAVDLATDWLLGSGRTVIELDNESVSPSDVRVSDVVRALSPLGASPRVMMVCRLFYPWVGGMERQALKLAKELQLQGVDVTIATGWWFRGTPRRETIEGVEVVRNFTMWEFFGVRGLRRLGHYLYMLTLAGHLIRARRGYDVVHVHGVSYHTFVASFIGRRLHRPVIAKLANSGSASDIRKLGSSSHLSGTSWMLDTALACDRMIAISEPIAGELTEAGVDGERIVRIPNGVDLPELVPAQRADDRLLFAGRLHPQKDVQTLLDALALMPERTGLRLDVVGDGPDRARLEQSARDLGVASRVTFHGETDDVHAFIARATALVLPSLAEGLSNSLLEAMAAGLPVVVSDIPANTAVVEHGVEGLVFAAGDAQDLASCLMKLLDDPGSRAEMGRNARATVEARYSIDSIAAAYQRLYRELTSGRSS